MKKIKEIVLFDNTNYSDRYDEIREELYERFAEDYDWDYSDDVPMDMIHDEMNFQEEIDYGWAIVQNDLSVECTRTLRTTSCMSKCKTLSLKYKRKARARRFARAIFMRKISNKNHRSLENKGKKVKNCPQNCPQRV
ncbi:MAG: hypothetical protein IJY63_00150 [Clostridia bacterium]|nr:hypothetical protein [Clostridia bacterium]